MQSIIQAHFIANPRHHGLFIGTGTTFWLGEQKLVNNTQDNQIQSINLCNMYFSKKVYTVYNGYGGPWRTANPRPHDV